MKILTWFTSDIFLAVIFVFLLIKTWFLPNMADYERNIEKILSGRVMGKDISEVKNQIINYIIKNRARVISCIATYTLFSVGIASKLFWLPSFINLVKGISNYSVILSDVVTVLIILILTFILAIPLAMLMRRIHLVSSHALNRLGDSH